jgi:hypothetical protein
MLPSFHLSIHGLFEIERLRRCDGRLDIKEFSGLKREARSIPLASVVTRINFFGYLSKYLFVRVILTFLCKNDWLSIRSKSSSG